jgi:RimJ/RimL family protein N-acetyltransferase
LVPAIETKRLRLRGHGLGDFDEMAQMWADPVVVRYIGGRASSREETWGRLHRYGGHWLLLGFGYWAIEDKASGRFVGEGGFADFRRGLGAVFDAPEQGWSLASWAQGKGYAFEAMAAALAWGQAHFKRSDFVCMIEPNNAASLKLAAKLGYRERSRTLYHGGEVVLMRRD